MEFAPSLDIIINETLPALQKVIYCIFHYFVRHNISYHCACSSLSHSHYGTEGLRKLLGMYTESGYRYLVKFRYQVNFNG